MKLNKTGLLLLLLGILVIVLANLSAAHSQQVSGQHQLSDELTLSKQRLAIIELEPLYAQQADLQRQIEQATASIEENKSMLSVSLDSTEASDNLFKIARDAGVQIAAVNSSGINVENLDGIPMFILPLTVKAIGYPTNLMAFVISLNQSLQTGAVQSVELTIAEVQEESSVNVRVSIYTYRSN